MERDKLLLELKRTVDELQAFNELGKTITSTLDIKEVLKITMQKISELLKPDSWALLMVDEKTQELVFEIVVGRETDLFHRRRMPLSEGIPGFIARERKNVLHPDPTRARMFSIPEELLATCPDFSLLGVPLVSKGRILGVMELINHDVQRNPFREGDLSLLATFADYASIAIENAKNFQRIEELTISDDVTTLYNSRHMHNILETELMRCRRYNQRFGLVFLDLDHFKEVNDTHGHLVGSALLRELAVFILRTIRNIDVATRYGGDEFVLILPQTDKTQAKVVAERLCENLRQQRFLTDRGLSVRITASFGVASYPDDAADKDGLIRMADQAKYYVKETTRNAVATAGEYPAKGGNPAQGAAAQ
jgi:diguanylate cyclase (GGDEF)-like protein